MSVKTVKAAELQQHSTPESCWLIVNGEVWDLTEFAPEHPGGVNVIHKYAGRDASAEFNSIHAPSLLSNELDSSKRIGSFDKSSVPPGSDIMAPPESPAASAPAPASASASASPKDEKKQAQGRRPLETIISSHDFEEAASENLSAKGWAFFSSAATDCVTHKANLAYFDRIWLRPRIMTDVKEITTTTKVLGNKVAFPLFVSPTAMAKLSHPDGELVIAKGCANYNIAQTISTNASYPLKDITSAADIPFFFQLYVNKERSASEKLLKQAEACGVRAIFVTVDQPTPGKREADERVKNDAATLAPTPNGATARNDSKGSSLGRTMAGFIDPTLNWRDIRWLRSATRLPIVLKGVQTAEDAVIAAELGIDGLLLGNHGGRSLDTSTPAIMILYELRRKCPEVFDKMEIFLDGGIRRGTDIFKALCLGAKAVGMGRPFLYAANYGPDGVGKLIDIMQDEFETTMRMMGCTDVSQLHPGMLHLADIDHWFREPVDTRRPSKL